MNLSYWERKQWLSNIDFTIVGSGIVGLNCALQLRENHPKANILILERGTFPQGASTKNAGFACFGSVSELLDDLENHSEEEVFNLVKLRWSGLQNLRKRIGDKRLDFQQNGGYEVFLEENQAVFEACVTHLQKVNTLLKPIFKKEVYSLTNNTFQFENVLPNYIFNAFEGQLNTGKMMDSLLQLAHKENINIMNSIDVESYAENGDFVTVKTNQFEYKTRKLFIATNGFASQLRIENVEPARAQVLITKPIENLPIKGTFHLDKGYYYFRNIDDRILLGGGRNLNIKQEATTAFGQTELVQNHLEKLLKTVILPQTSFEIDHCWSGIMGVGPTKKPIVKQFSNNVFCGVRLGGMGVAIGAQVGNELASLVA